jgi:hypothetical protein
MSGQIGISYNTYKDSGTLSPTAGSPSTVTVVPASPGQRILIHYAYAYTSYYCTVVITGTFNGVSRTILSSSAGGTATSASQTDIEVATDVNTAITATCTTGAYPDGTGAATLICRYVT